MYIIEAMTSSRCFNRILFCWYKKYGRHDLPWRKTADPYKILVSEMMLQQTQVDRVLPKYREFLHKFSTASALATATLGDVLRLWSGLGYNRRAKYLQDASRVLSANRGARSGKRKARWPETFDALQELPGIGRSTAAALCAFAFGQDEPMIDTNIRRIICRVFFPRKIPSDEKIYAFAKTLIPRGKAREWNWAMMDVGALLCTAKNHSPECPFQKLHGAVGDFVYKKPQKKFAGSDRFYRGRIIATLAQRSRLSFTALRTAVKLPPMRFTAILSGLKKEQLVICRGKCVELPG